MLDYDTPQPRRRRKFWESGKGGMQMLEDEDDAVRLDPGYLLQAAGDYAGFVGDQLQFTGYDIGSGRISRAPESIADDVSIADYSDQWELERQRYASQLRAMKERDKALVRSANDKMKRAKEKGRSRATLTPDEIDALERRRLQENSPRHSSSSSKEHRRSSSGKNSRSNSASNLAVEKTRRKSGSRFFSSPAANSSRTRIPKTSPKPSRHASLDGVASNAPGFVVPGPDGHPVYAPLPHGYPYSRSDAARSTSSSNQNSQASRSGEYIPYSPRFFTPQDHRPTTSTTSSRRSPTDELHMPRARERATSSLPYPTNEARTTSRRNVSGPAGLDYSRQRRSRVEVPPSPLAEYPPRGESLGTGLNVGDFEVRNEDDDDGVMVVEGETSEEGSDLEGVRVEVEQEGRRIERVPVGGRGKERERRDRRKRK